MGHAIIVYRERHALIHDMDLCGIQHFLLTEAEAAGTRDLADFVRGWEWVGNGVWIGDDFDAFFNGDARREQGFVKVLDATRARLEAFGENIPTAYFTANPDAFFTEAQPVRRLVEQLAKLRDLFRATQPTP